MTVKRYTPTQCCQHDGTYVSYTDYQELEKKLKAERQRADNLVLQVNTQANMREKAEKERDGVVKNYNRVTDERNSALYEVGALKTKLANPVVLTDCTFEAVSHMAHWYSEGECVAWVSGVEHVKKQILEAGFTVKGE